MKWISHYKIIKTIKTLFKPELNKKQTAKPNLLKCLFLSQWYSTLCNCTLMICCILRSIPIKLCFVRSHHKDCLQLSGDFHGKINLLDLKILGDIYFSKFLVTTVFLVDSISGNAWGNRSLTEFFISP